MCVEKDHLWAHTTGENGFTGRKRITCHTKMCKNSFSSNRYILESSSLYTFCDVQKSVKIGFIFVVMLYDIPFP